MLVQFTQAAAQRRQCTVTGLDILKPCDKPRRRSFSGARSCWQVEGSDGSSRREEPSVAVIRLSPWSLWRRDAACRDGGNVMHAGVARRNEEGTPCSR